MNVLEYLNKNGIAISAVCGGEGRCGKCLVSIDGGDPVPACRTEYVEGMDIRVPDAGADMKVLADATDAEAGEDSGHYGVAVDVGTTTIAGVLCDRGSGRVMESATRLNSGRSFGADVISRIKAAGEGYSVEMQMKLRDDIKEVIAELIRSTGIRDIELISLAGNTTMIHTLNGYYLPALGTYPYEPAHTELIDSDAGRILGYGEEFIRDTRTIVFPGVSAFVGSDIVSGLYYLDAHNKGAKTYGMMDIGTNGEMALVKDGNIFVASTAAGPVFEGGEISCGTGSVPGAIDHMKIGEDGKAQYTVIADAAGRARPATGLCGSGVIDCVAELIRTKRCSEHGTFASDVTDDSTVTIDAGYVIAKPPVGGRLVFTQDDMRHVQLAKAAIAAGFEILCERAGLIGVDVEYVFLAGGMGNGIDTKSAIRIGMIPGVTEKSVSAVGNISLKGAMRLLSGNTEDRLREISAIKHRCSAVDLASDPTFQERYVSHMDFDM